MFEIPVQITVLAPSDVWPAVAAVGAVLQAVLTALAFWLTNKATQDALRREANRHREADQRFVRAVDKAYQAARTATAGLLIMDMGELAVDTVSFRVKDIPAAYNADLALALTRPIQDWPDAVFYTRASACAVALDRYVRACQAYVQAQGFKESVEIRLARALLDQADDDFTTAKFDALLGG
ncbi:MAG: hypothetical protein EOP20_00690 [Hyphomicrobiales bacterium]|nr:MAG: hypothetical protein EOP20_00690 [Hyphomicrobiales bacterium]